VDRLLNIPTGKEHRLKARPIVTPLITVDSDLETVLLESLDHPLHDGEVVCVASKVIAIAQQRLVNLSQVKISDQAKKLPPLVHPKDPATRLALAELVVREADHIFPFENAFVYLTLKDHALVANAGIDLSNVPPGHAVLWPEDPWNWANQFRRLLMSHFGLSQMGVIVTDSHLSPLRRGVTGMAIAFSGIVGIQSEIGMEDLYGKPLAFTEKAIAHDLASTAVLISGEANECSPLAVIDQAPVMFTDETFDPQQLMIDPAIDIFAAIYNQAFQDLMKIKSP
jgi:coenzyme F420-0:L-glutamate ligase